MDAVAGQVRVGPYALHERLGSGGAASVYRARAADGRDVAVKLLSPPGDAPSDEDLARFRREIDALRRLRHPNVIELLDSGVDPARGPYLVTPLLSGVTLRELAAAPLSPEIALVVLHYVAAALTCLHDAALVHRDVKPENVMLTRDGRLLLIDLGLALDPEHTRYTQEGAVAGSVPYMAPEQVEGGAIAPASDVWSLGVIGYELIAGRRPFQRERQREEVAALLTGRYAPLAEADRRVSPAYEEMIAAFLQLDAARRPPNAHAALALIDRQIDWTDRLDAELAALAESPQRYQDSARPLLAASIAAAARRALDAGDPFRAMREIDRGLAYAPDDPQLRALFDDALARQRAAPPPVAPAPERSRKKLWIGGGAATAAVGGLVAYLLLGGGYDVDFSDPRSVTEAIFAAARDGDAGQLASLCDPMGENDGDTRRICELTTDSADWAGFVMTFEQGRVLSARVGPNRAEVDFAFGPGGSRTETMNLVKRGGKWYLASF